MALQPDIFKEVHYFNVNILDLERYLQKFYNLPEIDLVDRLGLCVGDKVHVKASFPLSSYQRREIEDAVEDMKRGKPFELRFIFSDLEVRGQITAGDYVVNVEY